ncbi:hypothetical protein KP509_03G017400 [Ceratopteris richardii]|uniref:OVATE domain-containing protein n=2 Tax=Ceratopteris richardii TaxID=49495 RepID=A0A8T2V9F2_CERRI|nr:hypothetical protein KP509_03G017400 [Ceratopteris richardii]
MDNGLDSDADGSEDLRSPQTRSRRLNNGAATFDFSELERKLKAVGDDRRKYYASPMLSTAVPTPVADADDVTGEQGIMHKKKSFPKAAYVRRYTWGTQADAGHALERGRAIYYDSFNESNSPGQSTPSSDSAMEQRSSSLWERDAFSIDSERSDNSTMHEEVPQAMNPMKPQRSPAHPREAKPRELMTVVQRNPPSYVPDPVEPSNGTILADFASAFRKDHAFSKAIHAEKVNSDLYKDQLYGGSVHAESSTRISPQTVFQKGRRIIRDTDMRTDSSPKIEVLSRRNSDMYEERSFDHLESLANDASVEGRSRRFYNKDSSPASSRVSTSWKGRYTAELMNEYYPVGVSSGSSKHAKTTNNIPRPPGPGREDGKSRRPRSADSDQFSYAGCKERLLSGRASIEHGHVAVASDNEADRLTNYDRFKMRQMSARQGVMDDRKSLSLSLDTSPPAMSIDAAIDHSNYVTRYGSHQSTPERHHVRASTQMSPSSYLMNLSSRGKTPHGDHRPPPNPHERSPSNAQKALHKRPTGDTNTDHAQYSSRGSWPKDEQPQSRVYDSFAIMKCSYDPGQDFKQSMLDMIYEKELNSSQDMVDLLQCYLTLNHPRYHDIIVKVFTDVWSEVFQAL